MHTYKVGIMSHTALVAAPSPEAAALFYGLHTNGNMPLWAVVYECDGVECDSDDRMPWGEFALYRGKPDDTTMQRFNEKLQQVKPQIAECAFVEAAR